MSAPVYVDLSNVCRDERLGRSDRRAAWHRWTRLRAAVERHLGTKPEFVLFADSNLRGMLDRRDQRQLDREFQQGRLESEEKVDSLLLEYAVDDGAYVLSNDRFTDFMKMSGITDLRVLRWSVPGREPVIHQEALQVPHSVLISKRIEDEGRKGGRADTVELAHRWLCRNAACIQQWVLVPNFRGGSAQCPECDAYLSRDGQWHDASMLKLLYEGQVVERRILEDGDTLIVGRRRPGAGSMNAARFLHPDQQQRISRRHVQVRNKAGELLVEEMGARNGAQVLHPVDRRLWRRAWRPAVPLVPGNPVRLAPGVRVRLADTSLMLEVSGRSFGR